MRFPLAVNPAMAQRLFEGFGVGDGFLAGVLFENAQPDAFRPGMVFRQPAAEIFCGPEMQCWQGAVGHSAIIRSAFVVFQFRVVA